MRVPGDFTCLVAPRPSFGALLRSNQNGTSSYQKKLPPCPPALYDACRITLRMTSWDGVVGEDVASWARAR